MDKILVSLPDDLSVRFKAIVPSKQRSKLVTILIENEVKRREQLLYECAVAVESDEKLNADMGNWDITLKDGLTDE